MAQVQTGYPMEHLRTTRVGFQRILAALDQLEAACERRVKAKTERGNLEEELAVLQDDRTRLALELDDAQARAKSLELARRSCAPARQSRLEHRNDFGASHRSRPLKGSIERDRGGHMRGR